MDEVMVIERTRSAFPGAPDFSSGTSSSLCALDLWPKATAALSAIFFTGFFPALSIFTT
jgi:hypothetical protein